MEISRIILLIFFIGRCLKQEVSAKGKATLLVQTEDFLSRVSFCVGIVYTRYACSALMVLHCNGVQILKFWASTVYFNVQNQDS
jgi:hypothetical protein